MQLPHPIDLRSDFLAHPTDRMLDAYRAAAPRGRYGLREDPFQRELEARLAALLGAEDALIFPTCTMANQTALLLQTSPGDTVICQERAHILTSEAGGAAAWAGVTLRPVPGHETELPVEHWIEATRAPESVSGSRPSLCCFENTHNRLGGSAANAAYCRAVADGLRRQGEIKLHLDGSRVLYAAAALGTTPAALAEPFDTVSISLNKGLGSPIAAALAGSRALIRQAESVRQRLGGGIRPVAGAAAAALVALDDFSHLADDIRRAKAFACRLGRCERIDIDPSSVVSNLVFFGVREITSSACDMVAECRSRGVLLTGSADRLRATFYRGIGDDDVERAACIIESILA